MKWNARNYQKRIVRHILANPGAAVLADMGTGKTASTLTAFSRLHAKNVVHRALVVAPLNVCYDVWPLEVEKWDHLRHLRTAVLHGTHKEDAVEADADLYLINPEGLSWLATHARDFFDGSVDMLIVDESTKFKHHGTQRFKLMKQWLNEFERRVILTGTPSPNGYHDLWGQFYLVDQGERLGEYVTHFRTTFFQPTGPGGRWGWKLLPGMDELIENAIADVSIRLDAADYLELPDLVFQNHFVDLPATARRQYQTLEDEFLAQLDTGGEVLALSAATQSAKLRQMANGRVYDERKAVHKVHEAKGAMLKELVEEIGQPTLVVYEFQHDLDTIRAALGDVPAYTEATTAKRRALIKAWNAGELPVLCIHPGSAGHGLNLQDGGHHMVMFGLTWNLEHYEQVVARIGPARRAGRPEPTFVHQIVARNTIDEVVLGTLASKAAGQRALLDALRGYRRRAKRAA